MIVLLMLFAPGFAALFLCVVGAATALAAAVTTLSLAGALLVTCLDKLTATINGGRL